MVNAIIMLDSDKKQCRDLCVLMEERHYGVTPIHSLTDFERYLQKNECLVAILDLDTVPVNNRLIRDLTIRYPGIYFLGLSQDRFHPDLKDAICHHIYACINKPVDLEELFYWLECIYEEDAGAGKNNQPPA